MAVVSLSLSATTLTETEVSVERLVALLNGALFEAELDEDGDLYVRDGLEFPIWIRVAHEDKLLQLFTYAASENAKPEPTLELVNLMNRTIKLPQFHLDGKFVYGAFWITYDAGLAIRPFVKLLRRFSGAFVAGIRLLEAGESQRSNRNCRAVSGSDVCSDQAQLALVFYPDDRT